MTDDRARRHRRAAAPGHARRADRPANRSALLARRLRELCAADAGFALLLLDVDRFQALQRGARPSLGDEVLRARWRRGWPTLRGEAETMRLGEGRVRASRRPTTRARRPCAGAAAGITQLPRLPGQEFFLDVSMGVSLHPAHGRGAEALTARRQRRDARGQRACRHPLQFAEERFERGSGVTLLAEQALRAGLRDEQFSLVYQPGRGARRAAPPVLVGFEALVRWGSSGQRRMSPLEFVPASERTGMVRALGALILERACAQLARWRADYGHGVPVAVNVSPLQLPTPASSTRCWRSWPPRRAALAAVAGDHRERRGHAHGAGARPHRALPRPRHRRGAGRFRHRLSSLNMLQACRCAR